MHHSQTRAPKMQTSSTILGTQFSKICNTPNSKHYFPQLHGHPQQHGPRHASGRPLEKVAPRCSESNIPKKKRTWGCSVVHFFGGALNTAPLSSESSKNANIEHNLGHAVFKNLHHATFPAQFSTNRRPTKQPTNRPTSGNLPTTPQNHL